MEQATLTITFLEKDIKTLEKIRGKGLDNSGIIEHILKLIEDKEA